MQLATLQFETKLQKFIRTLITILKFFIWCGISSDICSEIMFYAHAREFPTVYPTINLVKIVFP